MIKETLRLVAIILLLIIIVMDDFPFYDKMKNKDTQLFVALLLVACIYYDTTFGFIMALVVMLIYYEIYKNVKKNTYVAKEAKPDAFTNEAKHSDAYDYISDEHLVMVQNNVFDSANMSMEVKPDHGIGDDTKAMYGTQGMIAGGLRGYDRTLEDHYKLLE